MADELRCLGMCPHDLTDSSVAVGSAVRGLLRIAHSAVAPWLCPVCSPVDAKKITAHGPQMVIISNVGWVRSTAGPIRMVGCIGTRARWAEAIPDRGP